MGSFTFLTKMYEIDAEVVKRYPRGYTALSVLPGTKRVPDQAGTGQKRQCVRKRDEGCSSGVAGKLTSTMHGMMWLRGGEPHTIHREAVHLHYGKAGLHVAWLRQASRADQSPCLSVPRWQLRSRERPRYSSCAADRRLTTDPPLLS